VLITGSYPGIEFMQPAAAAEQAGIPFVDVPAMLAARYGSRTDYLALDGSHFNAAGNRVMAEGFASAIEKSASGK
ncbi:MAG: hypothetical protein GX410_04155, partial [Elusimicrobia bacterium]|nr:hypothetical protein [Elusimicrobiota bacterium]